MQVTLGLMSDASDELKHEAFRKALVSIRSVANQMHKKWVTVCPVHFVTINDSLQADKSTRGPEPYLPPTMSKGIISADYPWDQNRQLQWMAENEKNDPHPSCGIFADQIHLEDEFDEVSQSLAVESEFPFLSGWRRLGGARPRRPSWRRRRPPPSARYRS